MLEARSAAMNSPFSRVWACVVLMVSVAACAGPSRPDSRVPVGGNVVCVPEPTWFMAIFPVGVSARDYVLSDADVSQVRIDRRPWFSNDWDERSAHQWECVDLSAEQMECARVVLGCALDVVATGKSFPHEVNDAIHIEDLSLAYGVDWLPISAMPHECRAAVDCLVNAEQEEMESAP